jgi:hypothetical protein
MEEMIMKPEGEKEVARIEHILNALEHIETWCGHVRKYLSLMDPKTELGTRSIVSVPPIITPHCLTGGEGPPGKPPRE